MFDQLTQSTFPNDRRNSQFCPNIGMDPATIAGLVLGVAPLIISAVENYETAFQPFVTYRRYSREIARFATRLDAQKAIFNNQCQLLLLAAEKDGLPEDVILDNILKDPRHPSRSDGALNSHLEDLLGVSVKTCVSTLRLIQQTLDEITRETKGFQELSNKKPGERNRFHHFKSKIKISFSKTRLNKIVDELRSYNDDLRVLSNQVLAVSLERKQKQSLPPPFLVDLQTTQQASQKLHSLLATRWVCSSQVDHAANLSLDVQMPQHCKPPGASFCLSMTCISESSTSTKDAVWLNIESTPREVETSGANLRPKSREDMLNLTSSLRNLTLATGRADSKHISVPKTSAPSTAPKAAATLYAMPPAVIFTPQIEQLCSYFHSQLQHSAISTNAAIYSETVNKFEHFVYKCPCPPGFTNKTLSLKQILQDDADRRRREAWTSKFKLARLLALGVLRFQSTPWVRETLTSGDIHFLVNELRAGSQEYSLEDPFIRIQLSRRTNNRRLTEKNKAYQLSPNELLFNLGVILLELGYDAPLQYLSSTEDLKGGDTDASWYTDFITARRLGKSAARELDARYGRLAKKCLDCDFGVGDDLNSLELQSAILKDVVNELDKCIKSDGRFNSILT